MTSESWKTIPHVCYTYEADVTKFQTAFKEYSEIKVPKNLPVVITEKAPLRLITKSPILPSEEELLENNRAHSAKLRIAEKQKHL